ncbi:MAG: PBS lyase [Desulfobulbaceae bacterium A2]|nr:MAG: PBS lyase [Desulfobulbaceae bacterium A2]
MKKKSELAVRPWCPFCGGDVGRPRFAAERRLNELPGGICHCGARYVCDATGHNLGNAMVECLTDACGGNWDLAWELLPEEDYLIGQIESYDEMTHQVVETRNLDGRAVRGVLFFIRLHREVAEIAARSRQRPGAAVAASGPDAPAEPPPAVPNGPRRRADKALVKGLVREGAVAELTALGLDDRKTLRYLQQALYAPDEAARYQAAHVLGQVCAGIATREPGQVADLLHRLFEGCADSATTSWGMVEAIGAIIAALPDIFGAFTRHLLGHMGHPSTQEQVVWALGEIAAVRPDLVRNTAYYGLIPFLTHPAPAIRGLVARLLGRISAQETLFQVLALQQDEAAWVLYEAGLPRLTTVAEQARAAVAMMQAQTAAAA